MDRLRGNYKILASRLGRRLLVRVLLCAVLPLAVLAWIGQDESYQRMERQGQMDLDREARMTALTLYDRLLFVQADLQDLVNTAGSLAEDVAVGVERRRGHLATRFDRIWVQDGQQPWILLGDRSQTPPVLETLEELNLRNRGAAIKMVAGQRWPAVWLGVRGLKRSQEVIWGQLNPQYLWSDALVSEGVNLLVLGPKEKVLFDTLGPRMASELRDHLQRLPGERFFEWEKAEEKFMGVRRRALVRQRFGQNWEVVVSRERDYWFAEISHLRDRSILLGFLAVLLVVLVTSEQMRRTLVPIRNLQQAIAAVEEQRYDETLELHSGDEFQELGSAFNRMTEQLAKITAERDQVEASLVESRDRAITAAKLETEFLANVSHELRTPMTSIRSFAEILREYADEDPQSRQEFLDIIVTESERLTRLIEQILNFSKMQSGTERWDFEAIALDESLRGVCKGLEPVASERRIKIKTDAIEVLPATAGDDDRLRQVWINLLSNAIKFSPDGLEVAAKAWTDEGFIIVEIQDHGPGIHADDQEIIFERFRQACTDILTDKPGGAGLGLAIASAIVRRHLGTIEVSSRPGKGATFRVRLPVVNVATLEAGFEATHPVLLGSDD